MQDIKASINSETGNIILESGSRILFISQKENPSVYSFFLPYAEFNVI